MSIIHIILFGWLTIIKSAANALSNDCNNNCECVPCEDGAPPTCDGGYSCNNNRLLIYGDEENEPIEEDIPSYRRLKIIQDVGAKDDATFSVKHELISVESCDALVKHMEDAFTSGIDVPVRKGVKDDFESWVLHGDNADELYHKKLHANELVDLIGKDDTENIIDMFYDSFGDVPIDTMYLVRVGLPTGGLDWHKDSYDSLEITLNDNYEGGDVFHMTALGIHKSNERRGTAIGEHCIHFIIVSTSALTDIYRVLSSYCTQLIRMILHMASPPTMVLSIL